MNEILGKIPYLVKPVNTLFSIKNKNFGKSKVFSIGVPLEDTVSFRPGTKFAPDELRRLSNFIEITPTIPEFEIDLNKLIDLGNVNLIQGNILENLRRIEVCLKELKQILNKIVLIIGGEHTLTYSICSALTKLSKKPVLIVLDAHLDSRDEWPYGQKYSHATFLRRLIENEYVQGILQLGYRAFDFREELNFLKEIENIYLISTHELKLISKYQLRTLIRDFIESYNYPIHLSIDIDVLDPTIAPGVSNPEGNGITYQELFNVIEAIFDFSSNLIESIDIVEYSPPNDVSNITGIVVLKLLVDIIQQI